MTARYIHNVQISSPPSSFSIIFFFNDTATTEIYTLSLHDALPICQRIPRFACRQAAGGAWRGRTGAHPQQDRKSTRLNSSHVEISYAVFCLKKKKKLAMKLSTVLRSTIHLCRPLSTFSPMARLAHW